jgi:hypothetical protein
MKTWVKVVGGLMVIGIIGRAMAPSPPPLTAAEQAESARADSVNTAVRGREREDRALIREAETKMAGRLKDPASAQFTDVLVVRMSGNPMVCGYINAKNSFGGYTGRRAFVMAANGIPVTEDDLDAKNFTILWNQSCTDAATRKATTP